jgi:hypothetical protein
MYTTYIANPEDLHFTSPQEKLSFVHKEFSRLLYCHFTPRLHRSILEDRNLTLSELGIENEFCMLLGFIIENHFHIQFPAALNTTQTISDIESIISKHFAC